MRRARVLMAAAAAAALLAGIAAPGASAKKLEETGIWIEINDTDGDAGIQIFLDGEGWDRMKVFNPDGRTVMNYRARDGAAKQGVTEAFLESAEPSFEEQPLEELLALFPEGRYTFEGRTTEGEDLTGKARLTHDLPDAPVQVFPVEEEVDPDDLTVEWQLVADPPGSEIVSYQVVVETDDDEIPLMVFAVDVGPTVNEVTVPPEFLLPGTDYKWEVLAIERSGNRTISEAEFETED